MYIKKIYNIWWNLTIDSKIYKLRNLGKIGPDCSQLLYYVYCIDIIYIIYNLYHYNIVTFS